MKTTLRERFFEFDGRLAKHGVPPLTAWWRKGIGKWFDAYEKRQALELFACVGRGAAKSTALYKLATFFALHGDFPVPIGERHYAIVLSRLKEEAAKGVDIIEGWLGLLGIKVRRDGDVIDIADSRRGIRVVAASVQATSGWRAFFVGRDERSKWAYDGAETLDADEVDTSAAAMTATHALAPVVSTGSAWGKVGSFYEAIIGGSDAGRIVLGPAPTWIAAPHITKESTKKKERDPKRWAREYACQFQEGAGAAFDADAVEEAFRAVGIVRAGPQVLIVDPSSGRSDAWTWARARWVATDECLDALEIVEVDGVEGDFWKQTGAEQIVARLAKLCREHGIMRAHGDQREALALAALFRQQGIRYRSHDWTVQSKTAAVERVRSLLRDRKLLLPKHKTLRDQLVTFQEKLAPSGALTYGARGAKHDDYAALVVTACMADLDGRVRRPPPAAPASPAPAFRAFPQWSDVWGSEGPGSLNVGYS